VIEQRAQDVRLYLLVVFAYGVGVGAFGFMIAAALERFGLPEAIGAGAAFLIALSCGMSFVLRPSSRLFVSPQPPSKETKSAFYQMADKKEVNR